jgi:hypothetical protein
MKSKYSHGSEFVRAEDVIALIVRKHATPENASAVFGRTSALRRSYHRLWSQRYVGIYTADAILSRLGLHLDALEPVAVRPQTEGWVEL